MTEQYDLICSFDEIGMLKGGEGDTMRMYGWASTPALDSDQERVVQEGLDTTDLLNKGWINWNHQSEKIIGIPKVAEVRDRGQGLGKGLYTEFDLLKDHSLAQEVWTLSKSLKGTGRSLGLSLEGKKQLVDKGKIVKAKVMNIAVCPNPRNPEATVEALVKAIVHGEENAAEKFSPITLAKNEMVERIGDIVAGAMTKALDAGHDISGTTQTGGAAVRKEELEAIPEKELVALPPDHSIRTHHLNGDLNTIRNAIAGVADQRDGKLTKAEAALVTFLVTEDTGLVDCFRVFGLV